MKWILCNSTYVPTAKKIRWKSLWEKVLARTENVTRMWNNLKKRGEKGDEGMKQDCPKWRIFLCVICHFFFRLRKDMGRFEFNLWCWRILLWIFLQNNFNFIFGPAYLHSILIINKTKNDSWGWFTSWYWFIYIIVRVDDQVLYNTWVIS